MLDVGLSETEIPPELRDKIEAEMRSTIKYFGSPFDLAVDTAYGLEIVCAAQEWEIPVYVVEIAERLFKTA